jgi:hypothetical protein
VDAVTDAAERFLEDHVDGYDVQDYGAAADALVAAGLVTAERADEWKAEHLRLCSAGYGHEGPYEDELEARALELLETLFADVRPYASDAWDPVAYQRYQEALRTLTGIGALSHERAHPWRERQQETLTPAGGWPEPEPEPEMPFSAGELSATLAGPDERLGGMRLTCIELYGDCVVVRFHQLLPPEPEDPVERRQLLRAPFALQDDLGTPYRVAPIPMRARCEPRDADPWPNVLVGWQAFIPGAPLDAATFTVTWRDHGLAVGTEEP